MARGGETTHVHPDLGDDRAGGGAADAGDLIQPVGRRRERDDQLLELVVQLGDVSVQPIDPAQHPGQQEPVMVGENPGEGLLQDAALGPHPAACQLGQHLGVALARDQRGQHRPARDPEDV